MGVAWLEPWDLYPGIATAGVGAASTWAFNDTGDFTLITGLVNAVGQALRVQTNGGFGHRAFRSIPVTNQVSFAFYLNVPAFSLSTSQPIMAFTDAAGVIQCSFVITPAGVWQILGQGGAIMGTGILNTGANLTRHFSMRLDVTNPVACTFELYIDGADEPDLVVAGADLVASTTLTIGGFALYSLNSYPARTDAIEYKIDHMICLYDEYVVIPELELFYIGPNADDAVQFTRLSGASNFNMVDEATIDSDTTYNYSDTPGQKDKFGLTDPTFVSDYVWCVSQVTTARKEESSTQTIQNILDKGGTEYASANIFLATGYTINYTHNRTDPATTLAWDPADIAALKSGYKLTTGL